MPKGGGEEKRIDPDDGSSYTYAEMAAYYKGKYKKAAIADYWESCKPTKASKAKAKAKEKAKAKAKEKAKAKAKAKAKSPKPQRVIKVGAKFPDVELHLNFPPDKIKMLERLAGKKVVILGLPGAFTPC